VQHIGYDFHFTKTVRQYVLDALPTTISMTRPMNIETVLTSRDGLKSWREVETMTKFVVWRERCREIFTGKEKNIIQMTREILTEIKT
jgi:hypothetical protein